MNDHEEFEPHDDPTEAPHQAHPIFAVLPFVIIFLVLGALALLYVKKFGENPPPKPSAVATVTKAEDTWTDGGNTSVITSGDQLVGDHRLWLQCNAGMEVKDLRNCPEYKGDDQIVYSDHSVFGHGKHKHRHSYGDTLWTGEPLDGKRHKRPTHPTLTWTWASVPRDEWTFISTVPSIVTCSKLKASEYGHCESRPLTPAEIEQYKPVAKVSNGDEGLFTTMPSAGDEVHTTQTPPVLHHREPDCKMPADVDVCPVQTLDKKERHD